MQKKVSVVITDLDNTLYDWLDSWYRSFTVFLDAIVEASGISRNQLENEIRPVFQKYGTSEYPFFLQEIPSLQERFPDQDLVKKFERTIQAYRSQKSKISLYPTVLETLSTLKKKGCLIVIFTESQEFYATTRLKSLELDPYIDFLFSPEDSVASNRVVDEFRQKYDPPVELVHTKYRPVRRGEFKPDPRILLEIIEQLGAAKEQTIYIGDSLMKDILMAQRAGITDVHAKYGQTQDVLAYDQLRRVSHWTDEDILRDKEIIENAGSVSSSFVLETSLSEVLYLFEFKAFRSNDERRCHDEP